VSVDGDRLAARLAAIVGAAHVVTDPALKSLYEHDATGRFSGSSRLVVRPGNVEEVAETLAACSRSGAAVVPQGGHTGMVGGGTPRDGEVVLSLGRLQALGEIDRAASQVTVGAGVTLERLQLQAAAGGLDFPLDHGARSAATVGGMVATDAGGHLALRYGTMRALTAGVEAVLIDGRIVTRLGGLLKDNAGLDLPELLIGSEGILAVITRARLRLVPARRRRATALFAVADLDTALAVLDRLRAATPSLEALDYFEETGLRRVCERLGLAPPFSRSHPVYLVAECAADVDPSEQLLAAADIVEESAIATDAAARKALWRFREAHNETVRSLGVPLKLDVSVPVGAVPVFERDVRTLVEDVEPDAELILYGHLGDGNVHVNVIGAGEAADTLEDLILRAAADRGGSISAEHGVGLAKSSWLDLCRSETEISLMRDIKRVFDPGGILSPGRVLRE
jgi:FAD/FMN-containing dehydrogenase